MSTNPAQPWRLGLKLEYHPLNLSSEGIDGDFDELVVGGWLHIEKMNRRAWWVRVGEREFWIEVPETGPAVVTEQTEE